MATTFDILIDIQARVQAIQDAAKGIKDLNKEAAGFGAAFKLAESIDLVGRMNSALREIPHLLAEGVKQGIEFNAMIEASRIGVAGMLRQFGGDQFKDFNSALQDSDRLIELLRQKANQLGLSFESMLEQYRTTAGALFAGGVRDLQKQVDLTVLLTQAMGSLGITGFRAQKDIIDLLEGRAAQTIAGRALGVSDADIKNASQAGQLYQFLTERFAALSESGKILGTTLQASEQRAKNLGTQLLGIATQDVFKQVKDAVNDLNAALDAAHAREAARGYGQAFADILSSIKQTGSEINIVLDELDKHSQLLFGSTARLSEVLDRARERLTGSAGGIFGEAFDQAAVQQFVDEQQKVRGLLIDQISSAQTLAEKEKAQLDLHNAITTLMERQNDKSQGIRDAASQMLGLLREVEGAFSGMAGSAERTHQSMRATADEIERALKNTAGLQSFQNDIARATAIAKAQISGDDVGELNARLDAERQQRLSKIPVLEGADYVKEARDIETLIDLERQAGIAEINRKNAKDGTRDSQRDFNAELRVESDLLKDIRIQQRLISEDPSLSPDQKQTALTKLFRQEQEELLNSLQRLKDAQNDPNIYGDPVKLEQVREKVREVAAEYVELEFKVQSSSFGGQVGASLLEWVNSFGTTAHQVANIISGTLNTAIQGASSAITGLIFGTQNWRQAFASAAQSIVQNVIQIGLQILVQQTVGAALRRALSAGEQAATSAQASAAAAAWAPAAIAASIASYGAASGAGLAAYLAAIASGTGASALGGAFAEGGRTGRTRFAQIGEEGEEFVFTNKAMRHIGVENLYALMHAAENGAPHFAEGGIIDPITGEWIDDPFNFPNLGQYYHSPGSVTIGGGGSPQIGGGGGPQQWGLGYTPGMPSDSVNSRGAIFQGFYNGLPVFQAQSTSGTYGYGGPGGGYPSGFAGPSMSVAGWGAGLQTQIHFHTYAGGGEIPGAKSYTDNTLFWGASGEGIIPTERMEGIEAARPGFFHALINPSVPLHALLGDAMGASVHRPHFEGGGIMGSDSMSTSSSSPFRGGDIHIFNVFDRDQLDQMLRDSRATRKIVVDVLSGAS